MAMFPKSSPAIVVKIKDFLVKWNLFSKRQILDSFKLKDFADDKSKFDENGRKLS